jgi:spore maturation protein CgeB
MRIVYAGTLESGGTCFSRYQALLKAENTVCPFNTDPFLKRRSRTFRVLENLLGMGPGCRHANKTLLQITKKERAEVVWIDKGVWVHRATLKELKKCGIRIVHHITDSLWPKNTRLWLTRWQLRRTVNDYDVIVTSNHQDADVLEKTGAKFIIKSELGYDSRRFSPASKASIGESSDRTLIFVGHHEPRTERGVTALIKAGLPIRIHGTEWENKCRKNRALVGKVGRPLSDDEYVDSLRRATIGLGFVSEWNYNETAGRSYEIPACGLMLLAYRTEKHRSHYVEGKEAEFFSTELECVEKARKYLRQEEDRKKIAKAGYIRSQTAGYSWESIMLKDWSIAKYQLEHEIRLTR